VLARVFFYRGLLAVLGVVGSWANFCWVLLPKKRREEGCGFLKVVWLLLVIQEYYGAMKRTVII